MILALAFLIRIFERPYYEFNFPENDYYYFSSLMNSIWYVIITMSSVGYGDMYAVTPVGRGLTLIAVFIGVIQLSLMVALVTDSLQLEQKEALAVHIVKDQQKCARTIQVALQYNMARNKRYRLMANGFDEDGEELCPSVEDL